MNKGDMVLVHINKDINEFVILMLVLLWVLVLLEHFLVELVTITATTGLTITVAVVLLEVTTAVTETTTLGHCLVQDWVL
jgi:hypothetical protein